MKLKSKKIDTALIIDELKETDWVQQAYELKLKKYGPEVTKDPKVKAKQIRFLMYRGFEMDAIMKAINRKAEDWLLILKAWITKSLEYWISYSLGNKLKSKIKQPWTEYSNNKIYSLSL